MAKFVYMSKKTREAIEKALTLSDKKERNKVINHEVYDLFKDDHPDYQVGVSNIEIYQQWKKEFLAKNFGTATAEQTAEKPKTASRDTKTKTTAKTTATTTSRDKKSKTTATTTTPKTKTNTKSRSKSAPKDESTTEIDRNKYIAKLKADYISGRITPEQFATLLAI